MQANDQVAEWLVRWEEARAANLPTPAPDSVATPVAPCARRRAATASRLRSDGAWPEHNPPSPTRRCTSSASAGHAALPLRGVPGPGWHGRGVCGFDTLLAVEVALKVLRGQVFKDAGARGTVSRRDPLHQPRAENLSIVPVYDLGELADGRPFFVMKLIHGQTVAELLAARATPGEDLSRGPVVFDQVCAVVAFAHACDLIHRDLKPSIVMLGEFGEVSGPGRDAKLPAARPQLALVPPAPASAFPLLVGGAVKGQGGTWKPWPGEVLGTPAFMAPEQARGGASRGRQGDRRLWEWAASFV